MSMQFKDKISAIKALTEAIHAIRPVGEELCTPFIDQLKSIAGTLGELDEEYKEEKTSQGWMRLVGKDAPSLEEELNMTGAPVYSPSYDKGLDDVHLSKSSQLPINLSGEEVVRKGND